MKKLLSVLLCMLLSVCFVSCSNTLSQPEINKNSALQLEDLNFFDSKQEDIIKTTEKNSSYSLWGEEQVEGIDLQTYRGLKVGDAPEKLLEMYNLNEFRFLVAKFTYKNSETTGVEYIDSDLFDSQAKTLNTKFHQEFETATKAIENVDKLPKNYCVYTWTVLYVEDNQKVFTETEMRERSDVDLSSLCEYGLYFYVSDSIKDVEVINLGVPKRIIPAESKDWSSESVSSTVSSWPKTTESSKSNTKENTASYDPETVKSIENIISTNFEDISISDYKVDNESPNKVILSVNVNAPDVTEYTADLFIKTAANSIQNSHFENSLYESVVFSLNYVDASLVISRNSKNELSSNLFAISSDENIKSTLELSYQKSAYFSDIDSMKNYERDLNDLIDKYTK